ncbi:phytanoyl-CoA dioxygenase family protein [Streptomyces melanogenes]|uniref:Phytanoyl-CoA dioxygenase family protein n=1 Tax=Streptomyces melanogenes TaxID=67326 RepID=A0ABZ1XBE4_9ACTN|nr:phytanoyl-CoA dioxygenase family protein [Streptomyces melanogenes]
MTATVRSPGAGDLYPTRVPGSAAPFRRRHPVVWHKAAEGPLSSGQLDAYDRDGCLTFDALLSAEETAACLEETARLTADRSLRDSGRVVPEPDGNGIRSVFEVHALSGTFREIVHSDGLAGIAHQILGSDVYVHQTKVNLKSAFDGSGFGWHSDFETWHSEDGMPAPRALSLSIALTENAPYNGPLMIIPGAHRTFVPSTAETPPDYHHTSLQGKNLPAGPANRAVVTALARELGMRQFTGPAGSVVAFDSNSLHASAPNVSPFPRTNLFVVYNSVENTIGTPYAAPRARPTYLASRTFTPVPRPAHYGG